MKKDNSSTTIRKLGLFSLVILLICVSFLCCILLDLTKSNQEPALAMSSGDGSESNPFVMTTVADWKTVIDRASSESDPTYVQLGADITATGTFAISGVSSAATASIYNGALNVPAGKYINLDLKSYKINRGLCSASNITSAGGTGEGHVITVLGNLTLDGDFEMEDGVAVGGMIMGGVSSSTGGGGISVAAGGTLIMNGGIICYNKALGADSGGGGGGVMSKGTFILNDGFFCNNYAGGSSADGAAIQISGSSGQFTMNGGKIFKNVSGLSASSAGTISLHSSAKGTINDGEIFDNSCNYAGAGFQVHASSTLTMNGGKLYNNTSGTDGGALWINSSSKFIMNGGIITGNKTKSASYPIITLSGSTLTFSGSAQFYGNYAGTTPQDVAVSFTVGGAFTSAHIGISKTGVFSSGYGKFNPNVSASKFFYYTTNSSYHVSDTVAALGSTNEGTVVSGAQTTDKIVWKMRYEGESDWKAVATAVQIGDKFATFASDSYLAVTNPSKKIYVAPFATADSTTPLAQMTELTRTTSTGKTDFTVCSPSVLDYESGKFHFRYDGAGNYLNSTLTVEMFFSVLYIDVDTLNVEYNGEYQNCVLFNPDYLEYQILSTPSGAASEKINGDYIQFLSTGDYKIKLWFKEEFADQIDTGLVGWADTKWTTALEKKEYIEIDFTLNKGKLALPSAETKTYNASAWSLSNAEGEWCTADHCDEDTVSVEKVEYKNFASGAVYAQVDGMSATVSAGYYRITLAVKDKHNYAWIDGTDGDKTFTLTVDKAPIVMNAPNVDEYGELADGEVISAKSGVYPADVATMREAYGLEYVKKDELDGGVWSRQTPVNAGEYYVRPYILSPDDCNYEIDYEISGNVGSCYKLFERLKDTVAIPYLWLDGATVDSVAHKTTVPYTGANQIFDIVNTKSDDGTFYLSDGIKVTQVSAGLSQEDAFTVSATNMNTYTVTVELVDSDNTRWATGEKDNTSPQTLTLIITEAYLNISLVYSDDSSFVEGNAFSKGEHETLVLSAGEILSSVSSSQSKVTLDVTYTNSANGASGVIADTQMTVEGNYVKVNIDLLTLPVGTYTFTVKLREGISANDNYTLVKDDDGIIVPVEEFTFKFTILTAEIRVDDVTWNYRNDRLNNGVAQTIEDEVPALYYNGSDYEFTLDKLWDAQGVRITNIAGIKFVYTITNSSGVTVTDFKNAGKYVTTVRLELKEDVEGYTFASDSKTVFSIEWEVLPVVFDLKDITFSPNATFDWTEHEIVITNAQIAAMSEPLGADYVNSEIWAGNYKAGFAIYSDASGNLTYYCSIDPDGDGKYRLANGAVVWIEDNGDAYVEYDWFIAKAQITIGNAATYWKEDIITDINGAQFKSYLPKEYEDYAGVLDVRYYTDSACTQEISIEDIIVQYELPKLITYYVKVTINDDSKDNYELLPNESAVKSFTVGSTKKGLEIKVSVKGDKAGPVEDSANEFAAEYSGNGYTLTATASGFAASGFAVTYYKLNADGEWEQMSGNPTEVGEYKMSVAFAKPNAVYEIKNADYYLMIYAPDDPEKPEIPDTPVEPDDPENPDNPDNPGDIGSGDIGSGDVGSGDIDSGEDPSGDVSGNDPDSGNNGGGGTLDEILAKLKEIPLWQMIAGVISIILILIFLSKTAGYESRRREAKRLVKDKYTTYYAGSFLGLAMTGWTAIACVLMGLAVASLVIMLIAKKRCKKAERELDDAKEEFLANKAEEERKRRDDDMQMMFMRMMGSQGVNGGMGAQPQGGYMGGYGIGVEDMRGLITETVTALLPGMQQLLPQQA
ncbi:MAG: hypothetical protein K2O35_02145, partial [Clostridia bacterium]|nr:hypothetical protein [Clostridia bacterium]